MGSPQDCATSCNSQPTCQFWTFYNNTGACWLQGSNVTQHESEFAVSGPKLCAQAVESDRYESGHNITRAGQLVMMRSIPRPSCSNRGQAYQHATMKTPTYVADANACQYSCQTLSFCTRFTYYINSKGCWLLDDNVTTFASDMAISGPKACSKPIVKELEPAATPGLRATLETGHAQDACKRIGVAYLGNLVSSMVATSSSECQQCAAQRFSLDCLGIAIMSHSTEFLLEAMPDVEGMRRLHVSAGLQQVLAAWIQSCLDSNRLALPSVMSVCGGPMPAICRSWKLCKAMEQQHPHAVSGPKAGGRGVAPVFVPKNQGNLGLNKQHEHSATASARPALRSSRCWRACRRRHACPQAAANICMMTSRRLNRTGGRAFSKWTKNQRINITPSWTGSAT